MLSPDDCISAITLHSQGFVAAARDHLEAEVRHCPGWTVADLVAHLIDVHWSWTTIVEQGLTEPVAQGSRPGRVADDDLVAAFEDGARRMAAVFARADPARPVWTWAPGHQDAGFVIRHQVQEISVHHWDAVDATGGTWHLAPEVAADAIAEFLEVSVSSDLDPADEGASSLGGAFVLRCTETGTATGTETGTETVTETGTGTVGPEGGGRAWLVTDGDAPGTLRATQVVGSAEKDPTISATASDLLLWLYQRVEIDTSAVDPALLQRFRALTYTT